MAQTQTPPRVADGNVAPAAWGNAVVDAILRTLLAEATQAGDIQYAVGVRDTAVISPPASGSGVLSMSSIGEPAYLALPLAPELLQIPTDIATDAELGAVAERVTTIETELMDFDAASTNGTKFWRGTQAEYEALTNRDADTVYFTRP